MVSTKQQTNNNNKTRIYKANNNQKTITYQSATGQFTEQKIRLLKEAEKEVNQSLSINNNHNIKTVKNNKQELFNMVNSENGPKMNYIEKAFAGVEVYELPFANDNNTSNPRTSLDTNKDSGPNQALYHFQAFDPSNITIELLNKIKKKSVINPYSETTYDRMEESFRTDGALKRGLLKKWDFILGANMKVILQLTNEYDSRQDMRKMLKVINKFIPYKTALNESRHILKAIKFKEALYDGGVQSSVYNRAAIEKIRALDNTIIGLNVLETRYLGNPIYIPMNSITNRPMDQSKVSSNSDDIISNNVDLGPNRTVKSRHIYWKQFGVEYQDPETILNSNNTENIEIIQMKDIIYIARDDVSVSPGTKGFGLSEIEPSLDGSETKRIMKSYDFKEISRSSYSSFGVITALNSNITKQELQYLVDAMEVNGWVATAHQIKVETFSLTSDARIMIEILDAMNRETGRDIDVPSPLLGYEHVQNYASLQQTLQSWKESVLDADRRRIRDCIESQLLQEILDTSLKRQGYCIKLNEHFELQLYELDPLTGQVKEEIVIEPQAIPTSPTPPNQEPQEGEEPEEDKKKAIPKKEIFVFEEHKYYLNSETGETKKGSELNALNGVSPKKEDDANNNPNMLANLPRFNKRPVKPTILYEDDIKHTIELVEVPPIKLSFEISDPNFSIFKDKGEIGLKLKEINAIGVEKLLELMDMSDEIDDAIKRETENAMIEEKQRETDMLMAQNTMSNMNRKTDAEVMKMRTETKAIGDVDKFIGDDETINDIKSGKKDMNEEPANNKEGKTNKKGKGAFF